MHTVKELFAFSPLPLLEKKILIAHGLQVPRSWLVAHDTDPLLCEQIDLILNLFKRRQAGEPIAYIVGTREFMGLPFKVTPDVLIPRPDTECLVETVLPCLHEDSTVLDLCTGSGAIACSIAYYSRCHVLATDLSPAALAVAQDNAHQLNVKVDFLQGDLYQALANRQSMQFDVIVSNPPYISHDDPHLQQGDVQHEPRIALTDECDGLTLLRKIIDHAHLYLKPHGQLWLEHGWTQAPTVRDLMHDAGFKQVSSRHDLAGIERITGGVW